MGLFGNIDHVECEPWIKRHHLDFRTPFGGLCQVCEIRHHNLVWIFQGMDLEKRTNAFCASLLLSGSGRSLRSIEGDFSTIVVQDVLQITMNESIRLDSFELHVVANYSHPDCVGDSASSWHCVSFLGVLGSSVGLRIERVTFQIMHIFTTDFVVDVPLPPQNDLQSRHVTIHYIGVRMRYQ